MSYEQVILVDENDNTLGTMEKMAAHRLGRLHRAISVFIFNANGELLLQQRAWGKYHSAGKWSNTCCSHPRPGEDAKDAATRRLKEEMGLSCELQYAFSFLYRADFGDGLCEHELDRVFVGVTDQYPQPNADEVQDYKYLNPGQLVDDLNRTPRKYTAWIKLCLEQVIEYHTKLH